MVDAGAGWTRWWPFFHESFSLDESIALNESARGRKRVHITAIDIAAIHWPTPWRPSTGDHPLADHPLADLARDLALQA